MNHPVIQFYLQHPGEIALAALLSLCVGIAIGASLRLRTIGRLQQIIEARDADMVRLSESVALLTHDKTTLAERNQAQAISAATADAELKAVQRELLSGQTAMDELTGEFGALTQRFHQLQNQHTEMQTQLQEREQQHVQQIALLNENREVLKREFENLANQIFESKGKSFTTTSKDSMEALLKPFRDQITSFQSRINEVHTESIKGSTALEAEIKKVLEVGLQMNDQASNLTHALKGDKKTAGNWGEAQLERTLQLAGLQSGDHYDAQSSFNDESGKRKLPDFVIKLPDGKHLVIDSKVSLIDYDRAISADTDELQTEALTAHARAVRNHIDDLARKDYANLPGIGSPDFVMMFMPIEPAYIEAMKHNRDLFNYGYQKGVVMVSHTTLMPILRTVANLWMVEKSNTEAKEISSRAGDIYNQVCTVAERLHRLGNTLKAASNHYNETVTGLIGKQGLHGKVERFQQLSAKASKDMPKLEPIHTDIENDRIALIVDNDSGPASLSD